MLCLRMVLAKLQAKCRKQEAASASTTESKNKKPKKGIEEKLLPEKASCLMCMHCQGGCLLCSELAKYMDCRFWKAFEV